MSDLHFRNFLPSYFTIFLNIYFYVGQILARMVTASWFQVNLKEESLNVLYKTLRNLLILYTKFLLKDWKLFKYTKFSLNCV